MDGYCSIHYPPNVKKRDEALRVKWDAENKDRQEEYRRKKAEAESNARKLAIFPELLAALKEIASHLYSSDQDRVRHRELAREVIAKVEKL